MRRAFIIIFTAVTSLLFSGSVSLAQSGIYWEDLSAERQNAIISSNDIDPIVLDFFNGKRFPSDDEATFDYLGILVSKTDVDELKALYFYLLNRVAYKSDGALSETMGSYLYRFLMNCPQYVFEYLCGNEEFWKVYVSHIGYELSFNPYGEGLNKEFLEMNEHVGARIDPELKEKWQLFTAAILVEIENCD